MRNFKWILRDTLAFLLCLTLLLGIITWPYFTRSVYYYQDAQVRREQAGEFDFLIIGASHGLRGIEPQVLDEALGCHAYNACIPLSTMESRYEILVQEAQRNPIRRVLLEISDDAMTVDPAQHPLEGHIYHLAHCDSVGQWLSYGLRCVNPGNYVTLLYDCVNRGVMGWRKLLTGQLSQPVQYETQGFVPYETYTPQIEGWMRPYQYHSRRLETELHPDNVAALHKIIQFCREQEIELVVVTAPICEGALWANEGYDSILEQYLAICGENGLEYYDFNLYRDKLSRYPEETAFYDEAHLSHSGADSFSADLAGVLRLGQEGLDVTHLFYSTYDEAIFGRNDQKLPEGFVR